MSEYAEKLAPLKVGQVWQCRKQCYRAKVQDLAADTVRVEYVEGRPFGNRPQNAVTMPLAATPDCYRYPPNSQYDLIILLLDAS